MPCYSPQRRPERAVHTMGRDEQMGRWIEHHWINWTSVVYAIYLSLFMLLLTTLKSIDIDITLMPVDGGAEHMKLAYPGTNDVQGYFAENTEKIYVQW